MSNKLKVLVKQIQFLTGHSIQKVAENIDYSRGHLNKQMNKPVDDEQTDSLVAILHKKFELVLQDLGKTSQIVISEKEVSPVYSDIMPVKIVEISAQAGYARGGFADPEYIDALPETFVSKEYDSGNYLVFTVNGESMDNGGRRAICSGDKLLAKELPRMYWESKLHFRQYLFIIIYKGGCVCKEITAHNLENGDITLHSWNNLYDDKIINLKDVRQLFYVKRMVDRPITL